MNFKSRNVSHEEFMNNIKIAEKFYGVGTNIIYDKEHDMSLWSVAGRPFGLTRGYIGCADGKYDSYLIMQDTWTFGDKCPVPEYLEN